MTNKLETIEDLATTVENMDDAFVSKEDKEKRRIQEELKLINKRRYHKLQQEFAEAEFTTIQVLIMETQAACMIKKRAGKDKHPLKEQLEFVKNRIKEEFSEEDSKILLNKFPSIRTVERWVTSSKWKSTVTKKIKSNDIFSTDKLLDVYDNLYDQAAHGKNAKFIELYMELAGEKDKAGEKDNNIDKLESLKGALNDNGTS